MASNRSKRQPLSQINIVPYIDVMLVLLVIFMITAPLLTQGVKVALPQATANLIDSKSEPVVLTVDKQGKYYLSIEQKGQVTINQNLLLQRLIALLKLEPQTDILIRGDTEVPYGKVVEIMSVLQQAGIDKLGLMTKSPTE